MDQPTTTRTSPVPFVDQLPNGPGVSRIDPSDPAAPQYRLLAKTRSRDVEHFVRAGMPHGYYFFPGLFHEGDEAFAAIARFLQRTFPLS